MRVQLLPLPEQIDLLFHIGQRLGEFAPGLIKVLPCPVDLQPVVHGLELLLQLVQLILDFLADVLGFIGLGFGFASTASAASAAFTSATTTTAARYTCKRIIRIGF